MDAGHFDDLTPALAEGAIARRGALRLLTGGVLGVLGLLGSRGGNEAAAHNAIQKCKKIKDKKKRKKCLKKAKKHNARHRNQPAPECTQSGFEPCGEECVQLGDSCNTGELGICASGTLVCNGTEVVCQRNQEPTPETCNGLDDDCDGETDEGDVCPPNQVCLPEQGGCRTTCTIDDDCVSSHYCAENGICTDRQSNGATCTRDRQCISNACQDESCIG